MDIITPAEIYRTAIETLPAADIDRHYSDLYLRVTPASKELVKRFQFPNLVTTFIDNIDHVLWFEFPMVCMSQYIADELEGRI